MPIEYNDDPNMESQTEAQRRDEVNQDTLRSLNETIARDPRIQQWVAQHSGELDDQQREEFQQVLIQNGYRIPDNMEVAKDGRVLPKNHDLRNRLVVAAMLAPLFFPGGNAVVGGGAVAGGTPAAAVPGSAVAQAMVPSTITGLTTPGVGTIATTTGVTAAAPGATAATPGLLSRAGRFLKKNAGTILDGAGDMVGSATQAAGQNRIAEADAATRGNDAYERQLMVRSTDEQRQRDTALDNVYRNSWYNNRQASPYNTRGLTPMSDEFKSTLAALSQQGSTKLANPAQYDSNAIAPLKPYEPSRPGTLEKAGTWLSPALKVLGKIF